MAGEIAQEVAIMLAIGSATIGASGAIVSQVVAGVITGKREQRKADAEAERWKVDADAKRRDRQMDRKIELFSEFLSTMREFSASDVWLRKEPTSEMAEGQRHLVRKLGLAAEEIGILAPELYDYAESAYKTASNAVMAHNFRKILRGKDGQEARAYVAEVSAEVTEVRQSMLTSMWLFRDATRSYVSHEPVTPHSEALAEHKKTIQDALDRL
jgi:hypothetical protein